MSDDRIADIDAMLSGRLEDFRVTCALLRERAGLHPGHGIPQPYFVESAATFAQPSIELMVLREPSNDPKIFLVQRPSNDPEWPGQWHFPGTTHRYNDTLDDMMERVLRGELGDASLQPGLAFVHVTTHEQRERGPCTHLVHVAWLPPSKSLSGGRFFPIKHLPNPTIQHHVDMIERLKSWLKS